MIGWRTGRLHHEGILTPHIFIDLDIGLAVRKGRDCRFAEGYPHILGYRLGKWHVRVTAKNFHWRIGAIGIVEAP